MGRYSTRSGRRPSDAGWVVKYGGIQVECRDEADAKMLVARLRRKGHRVTARTGFRAERPRYVDTDQIGNWLAE